jgi:hypothetical protein
MMYREKLMPGACASPIGQIDAMQMCFASGSAGKKAVFEELVDEKILLSLPVVGGTLPCDGTANGSGKVREGIGVNRRNQTIFNMRGRSSAS